MYLLNMMIFHSFVNVYQRLYWLNHVKSHSFSHLNCLKFIDHQQFFIQSHSYSHVDWLNPKKIHHKIALTTIKSPFITIKSLKESLDNSQPIGAARPPTRHTSPGIPNAQLLEIQRGQRLLKGSLNHGKSLVEIHRFLEMDIL